MCACCPKEITWKTWERFFVCVSVLVEKGRARKQLILEAGGKGT